MAQKNVQYGLAPDALSAGYRLEYCQSCPSTNQRALEYGAKIFAEKSAKSDAEQNENKGIWFITDSQTKGRGRQGRIWQSGQGNLTASLLLVLPKKCKDHHILSFVAANALASSVHQLPEIKKEEILLKWPNDLLLSGAKLAGILLEAQVLPDGRTLIAIGFGVNIKNAPKNIPYPVTALLEHCEAITPQILFTSLSRNWLQCFSDWNYGLGSAKVLSRWREHAQGIGKPILVRQSGNTISGTFIDIDHQGRLIVQMAGGKKQLVSAGDIELAQSKY